MPLVKAVCSCYVAFQVVEPRGAHVRLAPDTLWCVVCRMQRVYIEQVYTERLCNDGVLELVVDSSEALFGQLLELLGEGGGDVFLGGVVLAANNLLVVVRATAVPCEELYR